MRQPHPRGLTPRAWSRGLPNTSPARRRRSSYDLIVGGQSNLTFRVTDAAGEAFVLRRPPALAHLLATAHDVCASTG